MTPCAYEDGDTIVYKYDNNGALATVTDSNGVTTKYYYDFTERLMKYVESGEDHSHSVAYTYDTMNNLTGLVETINGTEFTSTYGYNDDNVLTSVTNGAGSWSFGYDAYGRLNTLNGGAFNRTYNYHTSVESNPTAQLSSIAYPMDGQTYSYTYDDNGNILTASFGSDTFSYVYDSQNQLIRENNSRLGYSYTWTYDNAGNILSRSTYAYTTGDLGSPTSVVQYSYGDSSWGDLVTQIGSNAITYDEIGNMLTFGARSFTWEHGRQLASQTVNGSTWTYSYNADGMRTGRTNGTNTYEYIYNGSQLMRMVRNGVTVDFTYINGIPATISFNGNTFYYVVNGQGDVTGITDSQGNLQLSYYYDAWGTPYYIYASGNTYGSTLLTINPIMYRGYVFDRELGMYYLQSRYYVPQVGRFMNADGYTSTGQGLIGNNMFSYCLNNPINLLDINGKMAGVLLGAALILSAIDGPLPFGDVVVITMVVAISQPRTFVKEEVITEAATITKEQEPKGLYSVYFLCAAEDPTQTIVYVGGVKTANFQSRMSYHKSKGRKLVKSIDGLDYDECRAYEQAGMMYYHTINNQNPLNNQIRGISPLNPNGHTYYTAGMKSARSVIYSAEPILPASYWENLSENEFLNGGV